MSDLADPVEETVFETLAFAQPWKPGTVRPPPAPRLVDPTLTRDAANRERQRRVPGGASGNGGQVELFGNELVGLLCRGGRARPEPVPRTSRYAARTMRDRECSDSRPTVLVSPRPVRFMEMEHAVPRAAVRDALDGIRQVVDRLDLNRISFPVEVPFTAADDISLSTVGGRETAPLAVHVHRGEPHGTCFDAVEAEMAGRPHWGNSHRQTAETPRPRSPRFDDVLALRRAVDPAGTFANGHTERVLGPVERHG